MNIQGAVALVTGGASGLGEATVRRLVEGGARVVIVDRDADKGGRLEASLGDQVAFVQTDVTDATQVEQAVARATEMGPLRVAVCCAGVGWAQRTLGRDGSPHPLDAFETVIRINLVGTFNVLRLAAAAMAGNEPLDSGMRGVVVQTASVAAFEGQIGQVAYAASKGGIVAMTLPAARDLAKVGIRVVTIAPGVFDTPLLSMLPDKARQALEAGIPLPSRLGRPAEFAELVAHIAANDYLNGEVVRLDGALRMQPR